jgi:hypothetical protein
MTDSTFSPEQFLQASYSQSTDTKLIPVPEGETMGQITKLLPRFGQGKEKDRTILDVFWEVLDDNARQVTGQDHPQVRQSLFLDIGANGSIDMSRGKNVQLGKLREALGQNADGKPWAPSMMMGGMARLSIKQRPDPDDATIMYADVRGVTKA